MKVILEALKNLDSSDVGTEEEQQPAWKRRANGKQNKQLEAGSQDRLYHTHQLHSPGPPSP